MCLTERLPRQFSFDSSSSAASSSSTSYKIRPSSLGAMSGLIPLALATSDSKRRASFLLPACDALRGKVRSATSSPPRPKLPRLSPPRSPPQSRRTTPPASSAEWRRALDDVKAIYLSGKYEECSSRCLEILNLAGQHQLAYLVYLRFYAATALDAQASLPSFRHRRLALLRQAQDHYRAASLLAEQSSAPISSRPSSPMSSLRSSIGSDLSWSPVSTRMSSPDPSFGWPEDAPGSPEPAPVKAKKRVSFRDVPDVEPFVRPDSPTLGSEDWQAPTPTRLSTPESIMKQDRALAAIQLPFSHTPRLSCLVEVSDDAFVDAYPSPRYNSLLDALRRDSLARVAALDTEIAAYQAGLTCKDDAYPRDLKARAERLRANGWRRPRFDGQRYRTLRENALADLAL